MSSCLLLIDIQYGFLNSHIIRKYIPKLISLIESTHYDKIIASKFINSEDSPYNLKWDKLKTEEETAIYKDILKYTDKVFIKHGNSALTVELTDYIKVNAIDSIHIAGLNTECCVLATANALFEANISGKVLAEFCTTDGGKAFHRAGLKVLKRMIGRENIIKKL